MLKHIVFWKFLDNAEGHTKDENMEIVKNGLLSLVGKVPTLISAETGKDVLHSDASADMCLICVFEDLEGMKAYRDHPEHVKVASYIAKVKCDRHVIDYYYDEDDK